jgi:3-hydroxybutyryl-CoA dehydrogenase
MTKALKRVGVCGAGGTMGAGIAIVTARAGFETVSYDLKQETLEGAAKQTAGFFGKSVERGKMSGEERDAVLARMHTTTDLAALGECDLVIEAVFEDLGIKQQLFRELNAVCAEHTILASNTSTLSITEIASGCGREDRVVGMHFCLPAQLMKLIEMSPGMNTSEETFDTAWAFAGQAGQIPVKTQDKPGFILNALLVPFNNDVIRAVEAGVATAADIDTAIKAALGYKMGPCELLDLIGLDTQLRLCEAFYAGHLGRKTGRGFYSYEGSSMFGG